MSSHAVNGFARMLLALVAWSLPAHAQSTDWDAILDSHGGNRVKFGVKLDGPSPYERGADEVFAPASLTKLFTAGAALEKLGADYRFETLLQWRSWSRRNSEKIADLTVVGSGDPTWGMSEFGEGPKTHFEKIAQNLKTAGVREVHGPIRLIASDSRWSSDDLPEGWQSEDRLSCDGALPHAFNIAINCASLIIQSPDHYRWREEGSPAPVRLEITSGHATSLRAERDGDGYKILGTLKSSSEPAEFVLPIPNPGAWGERLLQQALIEAGIKVSSTSLSTRSRRRLTLQSPPLREILKPFLKKSINLIGQDLFVLLGGRDALASYVNGHISDDRSVTLYDGCGMSHANTVSARAVYELLAGLRGDRGFGVLWDALAIAGVDGTLQSRMRGTAAEGVLRGKTGTLKGFYHLAGYVPRSNAAASPEDFVPFVVLGQVDASLRDSAHAAQNRVGARLAELVFDRGLTRP